MYTINKSYTTKTEVKKSKFITYLVPISEYNGLQDKLKKDNPKSNHTVYAVRYLNEYNQIVENSSDDGEPKGCAGLPSLNVLRGKDLINCAVLIVRYFGGIKLGTGGMARAYALSVKDVIEISDIIEYKKMVRYVFETSYHNIEKTNYNLKKLEITSIEREFNINSVKWSIETTQEAIDEVIKFLDF